MKRIPYEKVIIKADEYLTKKIKATDPNESARFYKQYLDWLDACGWDEQSFDEETLNRIDEEWIDKKLN
jgi:hypothetical protein